MEASDGTNTQKSYTYSVVKPDRRIHILRQHCIAGLQTDVVRFDIGVDQSHRMKIYE